MIRIRIGASALDGPSRLVHNCVEGRFVAATRKDIFVVLALSIESYSQDEIGEQMSVADR